MNGDGSVCPFCIIVASEGDDTSEVVASNLGAVAFPTNRPQADRHLLVVPREHRTDWRQLRTASKIVPVWLLVSQVSAGWPSVKVVVNNGAGAGQTVEHLHVHVRSR